jgi:biopolymer transport protein ExbB/TolQ
MSDIDKLEKIEEGFNKYMKLVKDNVMIIGFLGTAVPFIFGGGYYVITEFNKAKDSLSQFKDIVEGFSDIKNKLNSLEQDTKYLRERSQEQGDRIVRIQEKLSDAASDAKHAKVTAERVEKAVDKDLKILGDAMKSELNAIKRATTNRLGQ